MDRLPGHKKRCLLDASSAILLARIGLHEQLTTSYQVVMSDSVLDEITRQQRPGAAQWRSLQQQNGFLVLDPQSGVSELPSLDRGERDTITLYLQGEGDFIMTDDKKAAVFCRKNNIPFINALLFPRVLALAGELASRQEAIYRRQLEEIGRYSKMVCSIAASCGLAEIAFAMPEVLQNKRTGEERR
jgi:predicted nucleic acid-binding protein